jgi:hypothetical protein
MQKLLKIIGSIILGVTLIGSPALAAVSSSSLIENFDNDTFPAAWPSFGGGTFTTAYDVLNIYATPTNAYRGISNATFTDLRNDAITIETFDYSVFSAITSLEIYPFNLSKEFDSNFQYQWQILPATSIIRGIVRANGTNVFPGLDLTYNASTFPNFKYLRLRADTTTIYWDSSPDGFAWTQRYSTSTGNTTSWAPTSTTIGLLQGTWQVEAAAGGVIPIYDNINNIIPLAVRRPNLPPQAGVSGVGSMGF